MQGRWEVGEQASSEVTREVREVHEEHECQEREPQQTVRAQARKGINSCQEIQVQQKRSGASEEQGNPELTNSWSSSPTRRCFLFSTVSPPISVEFERKCFRSDGPASEETENWDETALTEDVRLLSRAATNCAKDIVAVALGVRCFAWRVYVRYETLVSTPLHIWHWSDLRHAIPEDNIDYMELFRSLNLSLLELLQERIDGNRWKSELSMAIDANRLE
ncbi:hypothetical protein DENSPDRAFT_851623 [Dentipellis sp. KUC8613]|nr:hypothetical protein DENSPDRAFT_851623 [Dentipellis sp. KUC8613]